MAGPSTPLPTTPHAKPVLNFQITSGGNQTIFYAVGSVQGWRDTMEDYNTCKLKISLKDISASYFSIFDGHRGAAVSHYAKNHLSEKIVMQDAYPQSISLAIELALKSIDLEMKTELKDTKAGSTALIVIIRSGTLFCGNLGDSRAVGFIRENRVFPLSEDHKPTMPIEKNRIQSAGGYVQYDRVDGSLAMSRSLGDYHFKANPLLSPTKQKVSCKADVVETSIFKFRFVVLASDGVWDVMSSNEACQFIQEKIKKRTKPEAIVKQVLERCLELGSRDNMTIIIIFIIKNVELRYRDLLRL